MQVASMSPKFLNEDEVDQDWLEHEKEIAKQQLLNEGKPEKLLEKIIPGKVKAILKEVCLVDQKFVKDSDVTVGKYVENAAKDLGRDMQITSMRSPVPADEGAREATAIGAYLLRFDMEYELFQK